MQNGRADRIERSVEILSSNRVCPRAGLLVVLAVPTPLNAYTKLICTPPPPASHMLSIFHKAISAGPCPFVYLPAYAVLDSTLFLLVHSYSPCVLSLSHIAGGFPVCKLPWKSPRFQFYCSARAPPISPPTHKSEFQYFLVHVKGKYKARL